MTDYDVFNGDADGICALVQLRNADERHSTLVTGVKRDIALLDRVNAAAGDRVVVLDVSLDKNRDGLTAALDRGANVFYVDHHFAGDIPDAENLVTLINPAPDICTSLLVNGYLQGQFAEWAVVGAFGDNLTQSATVLAQYAKIDDAKLPQLERLGILVNYNGYGASIDDLYFAPDALFKRLVKYSTATEFLAADVETFSQLDNGYREDMASASAAKSIFDQSHASVKVLPDEAWARRVSGVFGNDLANRFPERAHAIITERAGSGYLVSIRAPLNNKTGADEICRQFPTGGGRKAAAGINDLPIDRLDTFISVFESYYR